MASSDRAPLLALALLAACEGSMSGGPSPRDAAPDTGTSPSSPSARDASVDAALPDASTDARIPVDPSCPPHALVCESFEDGAGLDLARWRVVADEGAFVIDDSLARDGRRSLHLRYGAPYGHVGEQSIVTREGVAAPEDRVYVRAYLRFADLRLPGAHPFFITAYDGDAWLAFGSIINDFALMAVGNGLDNPQIWYEGGGGFHDSDDDGDATATDENGLHAGEWICVEMSAFGGGADPSAETSQVSIDGAPIAEMLANDERWGFPSAPRWTARLDGTPWAFGVRSFGPERAPLDLWFDSIVISTEPIGCLP